MQGEQPKIVGTRSPERSFVRNDVKWVVRETDTRGVPGSKGAAALIFDSRDTTRRIWNFPRHWQQLNESELWAMSDRSVRISTKFDCRNQDLSATLYLSLIAIDRAKDLLVRAKIAADANRSLRAECRRLAETCRAERVRMRESVESHTTELRIAGLSAEEAFLYVASAVRETVAELNTSDESATRLESDTSRWCANAYQAA